MPPALMMQGAGEAYHALGNVAPTPHTQQAALRAYSVLQPCTAGAALTPTLDLNPNPHSLARSQRALEM
jgi:hypothetical protein